MSYNDGNKITGKHYWLTPPELYAELDAEFHFDFDPCPYPVLDGFDGLDAEWGQSNYVNPPFGTTMHHGEKVGVTAWVRKAITEQEKGKLVVFVFPLDRWVLRLLTAAGTPVRNLGDVAWLATEDGSAKRGGPIGCFILRPKEPVGR
jgi:hypothetical protein